MSSTICAISTPQASGGLGVIRVSGEWAIEICDRFFVPKYGLNLSRLEGYHAVLGSFQKNAVAVDQVICTVFRAPKSYTGEDVVEISCHGGLFVLQQVLRILLENGCEPAKAGEFTRRAFLNGKMDLTEAEAVMSLISAQGEQANRIALNALEGALSCKLHEIRQNIALICANLSAWVDYPYEEIQELDSEHILSVFTSAREELSSMLSRFDSGKAVCEGVNTAIIGKPNVGKSTIMNMLTGYNRSIVTSIPGTTRDVVEETVRLGNVLLRLADTAGIHQAVDEVEAIGVDLAKSILNRADLLFAVFDVSRETNSDDLDIIDFCSNKRAVCILNKCDLPVRADIEKIVSHFDSVVRISAKQNEGYDTLRSTVEAVLGTNEIDTSTAMLTTERQRLGALKAITCLDEAIEALNLGLTLDAVNVSADCAVEALCELTGERASEVIIDEVFSHFCVGK